MPSRECTASVTRRHAAIWGSDQIPGVRGYPPAPAPDKNAAPDIAQPDHRDPAKDFAERRGITFREKVVEIVRKIVPEKLRSPFEGLKLSVPRVDLTPAPDKPLPAAEPQKPMGRFDGLNLQVAPTRAERPPLDRAVERYARALQDGLRVKREGLDVLPHQREALKQAREALDAIRPDGARDLRSAFAKNGSLIAEAANGRTSQVIRLMVAESEIRIADQQRADRFVSEWQGRMRQYRAMEKDGFTEARWRVRDRLSGMAESLERDPQLESLLRNRKIELGIKASSGASLSHDLQRSIDLSRQRGLGL